MKSLDHEPLSASDRRWLEQISTNSMALRDAEQFVLRYGPAIQAYCRSLLPRPEEADDVIQELLVRVVEKGFPHVDATKGRFRDYLKVSVRNAVVTHLRKRSNQPHLLSDGDVADDDAGITFEPATEKVWLEQWRRCVLDRAWNLLDLHEREHPDGWACTVLRAATESPEATSDMLAERLRARHQCSLNAVSFRKQLSRARRLFARLVLEEVARTLNSADADRVQAELIDCGLWESLRELLPIDWQAMLREKGTG